MYFSVAHHANASLFRLVHSVVQSWSQEAISFFQSFSNLLLSDWCVKTLCYLGEIISQRFRFSGILRSMLGDSSILGLLTSQDSE